MNVYFTFVCFASLGIFGSAISFIFIGGALWCIFEVIFRKTPIKLDRPMLWLAAACYIYCAAYLTASSINGTLELDASRLLYLVPFALLPFSYSVWSISDKSAIRAASFYGSLLACYGALALALVQNYGLGMRAEGGSGNAIVFATTTCLASTLCLVGALSEAGKLRLFYFGAFLAGTLAVFYSQSRIVWVALSINGSFVLFLFRQELTKILSLKTTVLISLACIAVLALAYPSITARVEAFGSDWEMQGQDKPPETSLGFRVALWESGFEAFRQSPIFGHGISTSRLIIATDIQKKYGLNNGFTHFHNGFTTALVEAGLFGALALASIFLVAMRDATIVLRNSCEPVERYGAIMIIIVVSTYMVCGLTGILVHQDVLDVTLMVFLIVGTYLSTGTSRVRSDGI